IIGAKSVDGSDTTQHLHSAVQEVHVSQLVADSGGDTTESIAGTESGTQNGVNHAGHEAVANDLDDIGAESAPVVAGHDSGQNVSDHAAAGNISQLILCHYCVICRKGHDEPPFLKWDFN